MDALQRRSLACRGSLGGARWRLELVPFVLPFHLASRFGESAYEAERTSSVGVVPLALLHSLPPWLVPVGFAAASRARLDTSPAPIKFLRSLEALTGARSPSSLGRAHGDEEESTDGEKKERLELPEFFLGKYSEALELAKREGRVVLVGLFSGVHEGDEAFKK